MAGDPFSDYATANAKGAEVDGYYCRSDVWVVCWLTWPKAYRAFLKRGELAQGQELSDFKEGQSITSFVANLDRKGRSISLAVRAQEAAQQRVQMQELNTKPVESEGPTTIGDLIKEQLKK